MTFWQKSSEKCEILSLLFRVSSLVGIVLLAVVSERGMFLNNFEAKQKYFSSKYLCKIVTKIPHVLSHKFTLSDYSKESIHGIPGTINYL